MKPMSERPLMPLEEQLLADRSGAQRRDLVRQLATLRDDLLVRQRQLNSRETHRELKAALAATEAALRVLNELRISTGPNIVWQR